MNKAFELILDRLENAIKECKELQRNTDDAYGYMKMKKGLVCAKGIVEEVSEEYKVGWIPCSEGLPEEHDSVFAKLKGTDKWSDAMFEKISDDVNVTVEFEDGTRKTMTLHTNDGKWNTNNRIVKFNVIAWQPLPEPYQQKGE